MKQLLAACGIGGATVEIRLEETEHPRDSRVHGVVVLKGGSVSQHVERLQITLVEASSSRRLPVTHSKRLLRQSSILEARSVEEHPFSMEVPDTVGLMGQANVFNRTVIVAKADIQWTIGPRESANLTIVEHREISAVRQAMLALGFCEQEGTAFNSLPNAFAAGYYSPVSKGSVSVSAHYEPPQPLAEKIARVTVHMGVERGMLLGNILILSGNGLLQPGGGTWGGKTEQFSLQIACEHLRDREGNPRADVAIERINDIIDRALERFEGAQSTLLRGSCASDTDPNELLRGATPGASAPADQLLRPKYPAPPSCDSKES